MSWSAWKAAISDSSPDHVRQHAQLDLAVVGGKQQPARRRDKGAADLPADLGANRNVLQIGVAAADAAGGGARLVKAGVDASGLRVDQRGQGVDIGPAQLFQLALFKDDGEGARLALTQLVGVRRQLFQRRDGCAVVARGGALHALGGELKFVKEHLAELLGAAQVELMAHEGE